MFSLTTHRPAGNLAGYVAAVDAVIPSALLSTAIQPNQPHTTSSACRVEWCQILLQSSADIQEPHRTQTIMSVHDVTACCLPPDNIQAVC